MYSNQIQVYKHVSSMYNLAILSEFYIWINSWPRVNHCSATIVDNLWDYAAETRTRRKERMTHSE